MKRFLKALDQNFERYIGGVLLVWVVGWIFFQVISRYLLKSIYWSGTEEIARYSYIWMIFLGASMLSLDKSHLKVDILAGMLGPGKAVYIEIFWDLVTILFFVICLPYAWKVFYASFKVGRAYPSSGLPQAFFQFSMVSMSVLMIIRNIEVIVKEIIGIRNRRSTEE